MYRMPYFLSLITLLLAGCSSATEAPAPAPPPGGTDGAKTGATTRTAMNPKDGALLEVLIKGVPELSGRFWKSDVLLLPPAYSVKVRCLTHPTFLSVKPAAEWRKSGGSLPSAGDKDAGWVLFTPQTPGSCFTIHQPLGTGKVAAFKVYILHEAAVVKNKKNGTWRLRVDKSVIGTYPNPITAKSWRVRMHSRLFAPPRFWMRITPKNQRELLAPHVQMGQMVGYITNKDKTKPKRRHTNWFPPNRPLVYKLELLTRELLSRKVKLTRLAVNSGFRAPFYNRRIGGSSFSRHIYGDAADVMVDEDGDEVCDDINADGKADHRDGLVIGQALRALEKAGHVKVGGIGVYGFDGKDSVKSYSHFDSRGYLTRWGTVYRGKRRRLLEWWPAAEYREDQEAPLKFRDPPGKASGKKK
jgi:Peptidase M15